MEPTRNLHGTYTEPAWVPPGLSHRSSAPCTALGDLLKRKPPIPERCRRTPPASVPRPEEGVYLGRTAVALCDVPAHGHAARPHDTTVDTPALRNWRCGCANRYCCTHSQ